VKGQHIARLKRLALVLGIALGIAIPAHVSARLLWEYNIIMNDRNGAAYDCQSEDLLTKLEFQTVKGHHYVYDWHPQYYAYADDGDILTQVEHPELQTWTPLSPHGYKALKHRSDYCDAVLNHNHWYSYHPNSVIDLVFTHIMGSALLGIAVMVLLLVGERLYRLGCFIWRG
jgi:hypothetical protein